MGAPSFSITKHQLAAMLDMASKTIERLIARGELPQPQHARPVSWTAKEPLVAALRTLGTRNSVYVAQTVEAGSHDILFSWAVSREQ
jgi:hypothetical protein